MCGICGAIDFHREGIKAEMLKRMTEALTHRGPDDEGMVFIREGRPYEAKAPTPMPVGEGFEVGLGHRRLSIIDLSTSAHQPMQNEDGSLWIVYNGEVYNFQDLKSELEAKGHRFRSRSDTEVVLHAYEQWGVDCLSRFRGMFAFGIWDSRKRRLFLARDRLGKKPLAYVHQNGRFLFASEMISLLRSLVVERKLNRHGLHLYLTYQYIPSPESIFEGVKKLPPAHYLLYDGSGQVRIERYWRLGFGPTGERPMGFEELAAEIRKEIEESVRLRLISDVPLGAFLSGGMDSSLVVGLMSKLSEHPVKTFSIGFEEKGFDELPYARLVAEHFSTEHREFVVRPDVMEILPKLVSSYGEPFADSSAIPTYYVANKTKDYVKVVLTGDGGDENFAGYRRYLQAKWISLFSRLPAGARKTVLPAFLRRLTALSLRKERLNRIADFMERSSPDPARNYLEQIKIFNAQEMADLYTGDLARDIEKADPFDYLLNKYEEGEAEDSLDRLLYADIQSYLPEDLLVKMDIATMANSLEARLPFLDHRVMEFAARIPSQFKLRGSRSKFILKEAFSDLLPETILGRKKMGFALPLSRWFRKELKGDIHAILLDQKTFDRGLFRREGIERLLDEHMAFLYDHSPKIWALLFLEIWFRTFMDKEGGFGPNDL